MSGKWVAILRGPAGTPYEGGKFRVAFTIEMAGQVKYPFKEPSNFRFETAVWHPRVDEKSGAICIGLSTLPSPSEPATWSVAMTLAHLPPMLLKALENVREGEANATALQQVISDMPAFAAQAKAWTLKHAT
jgi:ubiquitin-protein ligase